MRFGPVSTSIAIAAAAALGWPVPLPGQTERPRRGLEERAEVHLRTVRFRVEPTTFAQPGECLETGLDDLRIRLRGDTVGPDRIVELERDRRRASHALLVDISGSMAGRLAFTREAAIAYVRRLRPETDRALLVTFGDDVMLARGLTGDRDALVDVAQSIRVGATTTIRDALFFTLEELESLTDRGIVLLLTDGSDTGSLFDEDALYERIDAVPDVTIFTIGVNLPEIGAGPGSLTPKKFLQKVAARTNGRFFDVPTASRLERAYLRIRELLDNEWLLTVVDREPNRKGELRIERRGAACRVRVYRERQAVAPLPPVSIPAGDPPHRIALPDEEAWPAPAAEEASSPCRRTNDSYPRGWPTARQKILERRWLVEVDAARIRGCALDVLMEDGPLFDSDNISRRSFNSHIELGARPFEIHPASPGRLPTEPRLIMDELARWALDAAPRTVKTDSRKQPADRHARPYRDIEVLWHGKTFLLMRGKLAHALYLHPAYRQWVHERLEREAQLDLDALLQSFRRYAPDRSDAELRLVVRESAQGREIAARAQTPAESDLQRYLGAWLGDVAAYDLFRQWEIQRINRALDKDHGLQTGGEDPFLQEWDALRRIFFVPSYARTLTPLIPGYDGETDRIGFWRVVLPRTAWMLRRVQNWKNHEEYGDLPLDLIPELPLGYWTFGRIQAAHPELAEHLRRRGFRLTDLRYELTGKARNWAPRRAFEHARVLIDAETNIGAGLAARLEITAEVARDRTKQQNLLPRLESWTAGVTGDPRLARIVSDALTGTTSASGLP